MEIYVGNLLESTIDSELRNLFTSFGTVISAKVFIDYYTRQRKEFGFVRMPNRNEAQKAIRTLNGQKSNNRCLVVREVMQ